VRSCCYPVLDDRMDTSSHKQFADKGLWRAKHSVAAWDMVLGERRGTTNMSIYEAPARTTDPSGSSPICLDVGSAELFRDEVVTCASKMWEHGGRWNCTCDREDGIHLMSLLPARDWGRSAMRGGWLG
jgi:hypothetical protein